MLAIGDGALASHRSAARLWGVVRPDTDPVDLLTPGSRHDDRLAGVVIHATGDLNAFARSDATGSRARTSCAPWSISGPWIRTASARRSATRWRRGSSISRRLRPRWPITPARVGAASVALRHAIDAWSIDAKPADSTLEAAMARLVQRYHLPPVTFHPVIEGWEVDFQVIGSPVILECDGWAFHGLDRTTFERDRIRDAQLAAAGWIVVRFTYRSITSTPGRTAQRIRDRGGAVVARPRPRRRVIRSFFPSSVPDSGTPAGRTTDARGG